MDTNVTPKVSVLMPVHNAALYLREAIDSILNQTFVDFEFVMINDGSVDASRAIVQLYDDPRIIYVENDRNLGLVATLNKGINLTRGQYIARMDADDISLPERFDRQVAFMDAHPWIGACGTAYHYFGDVEQEELLPQTPEQAFAMLAYTSCLGHPTSMIRRAVLEQHDLCYQDGYASAEDYALWVKMSQVSSLCSLSDVLLMYRWHAGNKSKTDAGARLGRGRVRALWYELVLGQPLETTKAAYLNENLSEWKSFEMGRRLISDTLNAENIVTPFDKKYYGALVVTDWELKSIRHFGLRALLVCLTQPNFHKWSRATAIGLIAYWLNQHGLKLKR